jgi:spore coat protein CotH
MPKRPYRIRFDQNTSLFGMKEAKNYILLANYLDRSLVRNSLVTWMSKFYESSMYTLDYRFVDLYINNRYYGQYLLMERVEFQSNRLAMTHDLQQDDAGFLIELDYQVYVQQLGNENLEWFRINNVPYVVKEPNPLTTTGYGTRHTQYIKQYFQSTRNALITKTNVDQWLDVTNWIHYFLIQEIVKNVDVGWGSVYMTKAPGGKLQHMPLWDFDLALGSAQYMFESDPDGYLPEGHWGWNGPKKNNFFTLMMTIPSIRQQFKDALIDFQQRLLPQVLLWLQDNQMRMAVLSLDNFSLWPMSSCTGWCPLPDQLKSMTAISQHFQYLQNYLQTRVDWMVNHI